MPATQKLKHLRLLEDESCQIFLDASRQFERPVMLYSIGKDSSVMVRLAQKAFYPGRVPFPLLHVDSTYKFKEMIAFRDSFCRENGLDLICHINEEGRAMGINPFKFGSRKFTDIMKTQSLLQALEKGQYDVAFCGARRDEEKSRAKERVFSFRDKYHGWDPKNQRPELWDLYNGFVNLGESIRCFVLSNWTELDVWQYIAQENIPVVPLYFAKERPVIRRGNDLIMIDDDRMPLEPGEKVEMKKVRFRTLGCYPLTGAVESDAATYEDIIAELKQVQNSERCTRIIDFDGVSSMEQKKLEGYF